MPDLRRSTSLPAFWLQDIPLLAHHCQAVRHALVAVGAAHRAFLLRTDTTTSDNHAVTRYYNAAVHSLQLTMSRHEHLTIWATLACCILFICFENLRGGYAESIRHLRAGARLLVASLESDNKSTCVGSAWEAKPTRLVGHPMSPEQFDSIVTLISRLGLDISTLVDETIVSQLILFGLPSTHSLVDEFKPITPFENLGIARKELHRIEIAYDAYFEHICQDQTDWHIDGLDLVRWPWQRARLIKKDQDIHDGICRRFTWWNKRFDLLQASRSCEWKPAEKEDYLILRMQQKVWTVLLKSKYDSRTQSSEFDHEDLEAIVEQAELFIQIRTSQHHVFAYDADIIPSLALAGIFAEDLHLLERIIRVLGKLNRKEGMWDSCEMADILRAVLLAKQNHWIPRKSSHGSAQSLLSDLLSFEIPLLSSTNPIAVWAQSSSIEENEEDNNRDGLRHPNPDTFQCL
jgi:hypothetical protein